MQKLDQISLQGRGISKEDKPSAVERDNEIEQLRSDVTQWQQADNPARSHLLRTVDIHDGGGGLGHPGVVIVTDHHRLRWTSCPASVNEGGTVAGLLDIHTPLDTVFLLCRFVTVYMNEILFFTECHELLPCHHPSLEPRGKIGGNCPLPNDIVFHSLDLLGNLDVFLEMRGILHEDDLRLGVVSNIRAGIRAIGRVQTDGKIVTEDTAVEGHRPFDRVETDYVDSSVL